MTDGGAVFQPGARRAPVPLRPRSVYAGLDAFGDGTAPCSRAARVAVIRARVGRPELTCVKAIGKRRITTPDNFAGGQGPDGRG